MDNQKLTNPVLWVDQYADQLYNFALKKVFSEELAKDLVQDTFLAALKGRVNFKAESTELTWLIGILKNKIIDNFRKNKVAIEQIPHDSFFEENGHWKNKPLAIGVEIGNALENKELNKILKQCINKLPALWLAVFSLKYIEDCAAEEICAEFELTKANYWVILHRSKLNLRACLQKHWL